MAERNLNCDWRQYYKDHLISLEEAVDKIEDGDVIFSAQGTVIPTEFYDALYEKKDRYHDVTVFTNVYSAPVNMVFDHDIKGHIKLISLYQLPVERIGISERTVLPIGATYDTYEYSLWENGVNASVARYCPPDENGWCNVSCYGAATNNSFYPDKRIKKKIAILDSTGICPAPGPENETAIHVTDFDWIVELDTEMIEIPAPAPGEVDEKIGSFIIPYLKPGDKVQIGYGGLGEVIVNALKDAPGTYEIFSEVLCDNMIPLVESGKVTSLHASSPGACVKATFDYINSTDKDIRLYPRYECIEPLSIMEQDNIVAINATFMVDLLGQCCSEAQGLKPYTGMGGSFAFIYGAMRAKGGRSFICLRSTYIKDGEICSNIVPWLPEGCIVSMLKNYVMFVVSEYGVADVYLKTYVDRIKALLKIAHPDFRESLKQQILTTPLIEECDFGEDYDMFDGKQPEPRQPANVQPFRQFKFSVRDDLMI